MRRPSRKQPPVEGRYWMFGIHAVRAALLNDQRRKHRLIVTRNAVNELEEAIEAAGTPPELSDARRFEAPLDKQSVHQGAALEVEPLNWGSLDDACPAREGAAALLLDRVTDPHNVGAILRTAEVFGASAVVAPARHSAPETGALAKAASGALERMPYLRIRNLSDALLSMQQEGWIGLGLDGAAPLTLKAGIAEASPSPIALVLGAEGPGLRERTRATCDALVRIDSRSDFASLNVSNAAAVALYAVNDA